MPHSLKYNKFLLFGDSITELAYNSQPTGDPSDPAEFAFGSAITNIYTRKLDVVQRGYGGYSSRQARIILPRIIANENREDSKILISTIFFGTNDAVLGGPQAVPLDEFIANTKDALDTFNKNGIKVVLIGPAKHDAEVWQIDKAEDVARGLVRTNENNLRYSIALSKLAESYKIPFVDLYKLFDASGDWKSLLVDGVHFNGKGYKILYDEVLRLIGEYFPELAPENLEIILPHWSEIVDSEL